MVKKTGWYYSTRGTKGLMPAKLMPGRAQSSPLMLVTYAALTHKLSSGTPKGSQSSGRTSQHQPATSQH